MRVLFLSPDFPPKSGGVAVFVHNLCLQLSRLGHQVDVLTRRQDNGRGINAKQSYRVYRYSEYRRLSSLAPVTRTLLLYQKNRYDMVFLGHFTTTHALGVLILHKLWNVPFTILSHGNDVFRYSIHTKTDEIVAKLLFRNTAMILANSCFTADRIREIGYRGELEVLNPGVDHVVFRPGIDTTELCRKHELNGRWVMLTVARLTAKKNVDGVLRALRKVIAQVPNVSYIVAGDGDERKQLEHQCDELGLRRSVCFLGNIENSQLPALYCASDLYVMPSYEVKASGDIETFGISYVEANACALPVIGGRSGGIRDAVIDGETGLLVDPQNVDEIASAIVRLLTDKELTKQLGENGRRRVEQELSWEKVGDRFERYLKQVQKKR